MTAPRSLPPGTTSAWKLIASIAAISSLWGAWCVGLYRLVSWWEKR